MQSSYFSGFEQSFLSVNNTEISVHVGGVGEPLLLLHGYPETSAAWGRVAPEFAKKFTCVIPDLRGYGQSRVPKTDQDHVAFSKREMAHDMVALMADLGYEAFSVLGHDRGARVSYRMALDHGDKIKRIGIVEVVPTGEMWSSFNAEMAMKAYHWTFLAQPYPLPENMIAGDPQAYLEWTLKVWTKGQSLEAFDPVALESYREQFHSKDHIHAMCEDYRAGATIDRKHDDESRELGEKIKAPLFFAWAENGFPAQTGSPLGIWQKWAENVTGREINNCGHFVLEENPQAILDCFVPFFLGDAL